jgi:hypothetical protein
MTLTRLQKFAVGYLLISLLPSYWMASWQHDATLTAITEKFERERSLHLSTDKLLINCELNEEKQGTPYDANHQICNEGLHEHDLTEHAMQALQFEKDRNDKKLLRNFFILTLLFNLLGLLFYKAKLLIQRETD